MSARPLVSIVVPLACGRWQAQRCLEGIALAEHPPFEVIVIDNASTDLQQLLGGLDGDVTVLRSERRLDDAEALALGLEHARGERIVLIRHGAVPQPGWLAPLARALDDPGLGLAGSVAPKDQEAGVLGAWSIAVRAADLRATDLGAAPLAGTPDELMIAALAVWLAEAGLRVRCIPESSIEGPRAPAAAARRPPGQAPELTIVLPTLDASSSRIGRCLSAIAVNTDAPHQVVIVDNGSPPQGFTAPVNAGLRAADTPFVVVMNDDVEPGPGWWPPLRAALQQGASVCFPLTVDGPMRRDFAAWCFAIAQDGLERFGHSPTEFFDPSFMVWYQDTDLLHRLRQAGAPPLLVEDSQIRHGLSQTIASEDPVLKEWIRGKVALDRERFIQKHPDAQLDGHLLLADRHVPILKHLAMSAE